MNLKKKLKKFFTMTRRDGGFTLVELIVVIAILGILAGVAVPAYGGYVKKANMQADITLAKEAANALMLHYYSNPHEVTTASVVLTVDGAKVADDDVVSAEAMQATFGDNWRETVKLKYDEWGNGAAVAKEVLDYFVNGPWDSALADIFNGTANISFKDNIPELFDLMEDTAVLIAGKRESLGSGAKMVTEAAKLTTGTGAALDAETFSGLWASSTWDSSYLMGGSGSDYNADAGDLTDDKLKQAIANAAVIKARNVALATYLKDNGYGGTYDAIANFNYSNSSVPDDAAGYILAGNAAALGLTFATPEEEDAVAEAIIEYFNYGGDPTTSQAYTDGLAYYAMMSTVNNLSDSDNLDDSNDATWWNDLSSAVNMYSAVANGSVSMDELNGLYEDTAVVGNSVVALLIVENGVPNVIISPVTANP